MNDLSFSYTICPGDRKTVSIRITPDGQVQVRCPRRMKTADIRRFVEEKARWIEKHLPQEPPQPKLTPEQLRSLAQQAKEELPPRVAYHAARMGLRYGRITIRSQHSRWGSCSAKGNLNFNCLLMLTEPEIRDYIIIHELCHLRQMNHSPAFWQEVEDYCPDYRQAKKWLKDHGPALIARLPE